MLRRSFHTLAIAAALPSALLSARVANAATVGQPAPDFSLKDAAGKTVKLSDYRGKLVVLEWTNPGCPFVQKHYNGGNIPATQKEAIDKGAVWLSINSTEKTSGDYLEPAKLAGWMKDKKGQPTALLMDEEGTAGKAYAARTTPHLYMIDPQGKLIYAGGIDSIPSARPDDIKTATNYVKQALNETLAGKPVSQAVTRPYGCSIKYKA